MAIDNKDKKVLKSSIEREQNEVACSAECEKIKGSKNLNVPPLRFPEFSGEWKCTTIGNIGDIKNGPFGSVLHAEDYVENGIPIVTTEHFKTGLMPSDKFGIPQVSNEDYIRLKGYRLETNDIVFSRVGSVDINAHVGIEQNGWLFSGRVLRVRPKYDIDSLFLHYALSTEAVKRDIRNRAVGQTMPSINTPILSSTTIQLPKDLFEQKKVAHFLILLDERIITQNKIIEKYESLIQAMCDTLIESEQHKVELAFSDFGKSYSGLSGKSAEDFGEGCPYITYMNVYQNQIINATNVGLVKINGAEQQSVVHYGDILFTLSSETAEEVGIGAVYLGDTYPLYLNSFCFGIHIIDDNKIFPPFLAFYVSTKSFRKVVFPLAQGSTRFNLQKNDFMKKGFSFPTVERQRKIYSALKTYSDKLAVEKSIAKLLCKQKNHLLSKLFI